MAAPVNIVGRNSIVTAADRMIGDFMAVTGGEEVLITADTATDATVASTVMDAIDRCGAKGSLFTIARLPFQGALADPYLPRTLAPSIAESDVWIDLTSPGIAGARVHDEAMKNGRTRYLLLGDVGVASLVRLFAQIDLDRYFDAQGEFDRVFQAAEGRQCRVTNAAGSDVTFTLTKSTLVKPRRAQGPGTYLVPGTCSIAPDINSVRGVIAIDAVVHEFYEMLREPLRIEVDGKIRRIIGTGASAITFDRALRRAVHDGMGSIIHFSHGLHPGARFAGESFVEDIRAFGNNAIGFGVPWWEPGGGENHPDGVMTGHNVWIESEKIIEGGRITGPAALAEKANRVLPFSA